MSLEKIPSRQLSAWLCAALIPVLIQELGGSSWLWIGAAGVLCAILVWLVWRLGVPIRGKWLCLPECIYIIILLGELIPDAAACWSGNSYPAVPLMLLALAAWSAQKGTSAAARVGSVLFWFILIMYLVVFGAGGKEVNIQWLAPRWGKPNWKGAALLLAPAASAMLLRKGEGWELRLTLPAIFCLAAATLTAGVLSPGVAENDQNAFYEMSRSLNLLGVAKRFEAVISAGMTVGWFACISLFLTIAGQLFEMLQTGWRRPGVWIAAVGAGVWMLCGLHISGFALVIQASVFWVALPLLAQGIGQIKKSKKVLDKKEGKC